MSSAQQLADLQPLFEQALPLLVGALVTYWQRRDAKRIKELELREKELSAEAHRLEIREKEREATVNRMRSGVWQSRKDPSKDTPEARAVQVCLDTLRSSLWPRGDQKRGGGA